MNGLGLGLLGGLAGLGAVFGVGLWLIGDELALPLLGLSDKPTAYHPTRLVQSPGRAPRLRGRDGRHHASPEDPERTLSGA